MNEEIKILERKGLGVTHLTWEHARDDIRTNMAAGIPTQVITLTPEMCVRVSEDPDFRDIIDSAAIVVADGVGVVWGEGHLTGVKPEKIPGIDLATWTLEEVDRIAGRIYLLGSKPDIAEIAADRIGERYPRLTVSGWRDGYFEPEEEDDVVSAIASAGPHLLLVGMGSPKQEIFISSNLNNLHCAAAIGVGGTLDVLSGQVRRAPGIFRKTGTEWLYRTVTQPGERLRRIPKLLEFINLVLKTDLDS